MSNFTGIQQKLKEFIIRFYSNELIKGLILFSAFGFLYFIITLFIEYFLWLPPKARSVLFFVFILVELGLLIKFIAIPISNLLGFQKGISFTESSKIIGNHFPEVDDKLLNILQLNENTKQSELLIASIEQKSESLKPFIFKKAVNFGSNIKYVKYLSIPLVIWLLVYLSGNISIFNDSLTRVVHYQTAYEPPAPFSFKVLNANLSIVEGKPFELEVETVGNIIPENVKIHFNTESYILKDKSHGLFSYDFTNFNESVIFYLEANGVRSKNYQLNIIKIPIVIGFEMFLDYPNYTGKKEEIVKNTGYAVVPEGTDVTWNIKTEETDSLTFISNDSYPFELNTSNDFSIRKQLNQTVGYQISTSNKNLKDYEKLSYVIEVVKDEFPKIDVKTDIDSVSRGPVQFAGQVGDDYGLSKLNLVYYTAENKATLIKQTIEIEKTTFKEFYYIFSPLQLEIKKGVAYEMYFEVFDNDAINGNKSVKSNVFRYYNKTEQEISDDLLEEQQQNFDELNKTAKNAEKLSKDFEDFSKELKNKSELNWNDKKELDDFLKRQEQYQEMLEKHTDELKENLDEQELRNEDQSLKDKKEELKKRIEEAQELQKKNDLLEQLKKMAEKLDKEGMLDKLEKFTQQNKQKKKTLERMLELAKRFFVEKKAVQISKKLDSLANKENKLAEQEMNSAEEQKKLNEEFEDIQRDFDELRKDNRNLAQPMDFPDTRFDEDVTKELMEQATEKLEQQETESKGENRMTKQEELQKKAVLQQKAAAKKMKQLAQKMNGAMEAMQGESIEENIDDLRAIIENLLNFSFEQEQLMVSFEGVDASHAEFPVKLKKQQILKEHFEHIDDSLYTLSLRLQKLSSNIQKDLTEAHYNIDKSLQNIAENRIQQGRSNQQYTMTAANNLADMLSDLLNSLQNPGMGEGKGKGNSFSLPDIIEKQKGLGEKMKEGMKKVEDKGNGKQEGEGEKGTGKERMSGEQYQIYQEQNALRQALQEIIGKDGKTGSKGREALKQMEALEKQLLDKGFTNEVMQQMLHLEHELLKLENATLKQGMDKKRKSQTNETRVSKRIIPQIENRKLYFNSTEILDRKPLPLKTNYKKKVQEYFKNRPGK
ncbi:MAG: hypothetical protein QNK20_08775 [Aureibaculum sp.]|nr:hypothetical protein [Aureibaculum sp.]